MRFLRRGEQPEPPEDPSIPTIDLTEALDLTEGGAIETRAEGWAAKLGHVLSADADADADADVEVDPARAVADTIVDTAPGDPGHCPSCGGPGYLDLINVRDGVQKQHCQACDHRWEIAIED